MPNPSIEDCIAGSYKEGFELQYDIDEVNKTVRVYKHTITRGWKSFFNSIDVSISRNLKQYHPEYSFEWC